MATIVTRASKGASLTHSEMDANLNKLNVAGYDGVSTPYLLRGTVNAALYPGVVKGALADTAARQANLTALQAALNYAVTNRKFFEIEPGEYEIDGAAGLVIPQTKNTGFVWMGTKGSHIKQFASNAPILTIGSVVGGNMTEQAQVSGLRVSYAANQAGNLNSTMVRIGTTRNCLFTEWNVFADSLVNGWPAGTSIRAHRGIVATHNLDSMSYFSNTMRDVMIGGCERNLLSMGLDVSAGQDGSTIQGGGGTGSVFQNIYMANGVTGSPQTIADYAVRLRGAADMYEGIFEQVNVEWCITNKLVFMEIVRNTTMASWHFEGCRLTGDSPCVINVSGSQMNFFGLNILDLEVLTASATGTPSVFQMYADSTISGTGMALNWSGSGKVDRSFQLVYLPTWSPNDFPPAVNINGIITRDVAGGNSGNFHLDANTPVASFPAPLKIDRYRWRDSIPEIQGATSKLNVSTTYYGVQGDATLIYPASLGAARVVTLAGTMKPSGTLSAVAVPVGTIVTVRRGPGTADGSALTVRNLTSGGTLLATLSAADSVGRYRFDGTNWAAVS